MTERKSLAAKGYDPRTRDNGMGWICTIEVNRRVLTFNGVTEQAAVDRAVEFVERLEAGRLAR